ncbi:MAG: hypothetical protein ABR563_05970 [Pyrinomonadaceae bacterium]
MNLRAKLFPVLVAACAVALVAVSYAQYRRGVRAAEDTLRADTEASARRFARAVVSERDARLAELSALAHAPEFDDFWLRGGRAAQGQARGASGGRAGSGASVDALV